MASPAAVDAFDVRAGEVHALLGENGAGKSTLIKIAAGVHMPDGGEVRLDGKPVRFSSPREANFAGIATVYQELLLFPDLTVAENIQLAMIAKGERRRPVPDLIFEYFPQLRPLLARKGGTAISTTCKRKNKSRRNEPDRTFCSSG